MARPIVYIRYSVFFALAVFFAVQASVAAWNLQIEQSLTFHAQLDAYLIFCGAFGLLVLFPIACIDILRKNAVFARVWFEAVWLALFFVFETAGAAALTAMLPQLQCNQNDIAFRNLSCPSTNALLGITWTATIILLVYMTALVISAILHQDDYPEVWHTGVRDFGWFANMNCTERLTNSPCSPKHWRASVNHAPTHATTPTLVAPKPRRNQAAPLWTSYQIEHYNNSTFDVRAQGHQRNDIAPPPPVVQQMQGRRVPAPSLYPTFVDSTISSSSAAIPEGPFRPAGEWPRREPPRQSSTSMAESESETSLANSPSRRQPRGPRTRPPRLDLSKTSRPSRR